MSLAAINRNPSPRQLRQFGLMALAALPLIGWWWGAAPGWCGLLALAGGTLLALAWLAPRLVRPVFVGACLITYPIGLVVGEVLMLLVYGLVFVPLGLVFRLAGRDALDRRFQKSQSSYWQPKRQAASAESYFHQS